MAAQIMIKEGEDILVPSPFAWLFGHRAAGGVTSYPLPNNMGIAASHHVLKSKTRFVAAGVHFSSPLSHYAVKMPIQVGKPAVTVLTDLRVGVAQAVEKSPSARATPTFYISPRNGSPRGPTVVGQHVWHMPEQYSVVGFIREMNRVLDHYRSNDNCRVFRFIGNTDERVRITCAMNATTDDMEDPVTGLTHPMICILANTALSAQLRFSVRGQSGTSVYLERANGDYDLLGHIVGERRVYPFFKADEHAASLRRMLGSSVKGQHRDMLQRELSLTMDYSGSKIQCDLDEIIASISARESPAEPSVLERHTIISPAVHWYTTLADLLARAQ